ncbi:MAG: EAL domain-containing protein [Pseudomonadota bacterium]
MDCIHCRGKAGFEGKISFAFQPIVDVTTRTVFAQEALVRGPNGEPARSVLTPLTDETRYSFDQAARTTAIALASRLMPHCTTRLSINILPNAIYNPVRCLRTTLHAADEYGFSQSRLMFEATEHEQVQDVEHMRRIFDHYGKCGFTTAIDDFGAGFAGLALLADFRPDIIKIDRGLVTDVERDPTRQAIISGIKSTADILGTTVVAEGVETLAEFRFLRQVGVTLFQGYLFARPAFEALPTVDWSALDAPGEGEQATGEPRQRRRSTVRPAAPSDEERSFPVDARPGGGNSAAPAMEADC